MLIFSYSLILILGGVVIGTISAMLYAHEVLNSFCLILGSIFIIRYIDQAVSTILENLHG